MFRVERFFMDYINHSAQVDVLATFNTAEEAFNHMHSICKDKCFLVEEEEKNDFYQLELNSVLIEIYVVEHNLEQEDI